MRLWSIHPSFLDTKGILAVWREGLLAKKVLEGKTKGYKNHPQLERFRKSQAPLLYINAYLYQIFLEAKRRGFNFDRKKIENVKISKKIKVTNKQVSYEFKHLLNKLAKRERKKYLELKNKRSIKANPIFEIHPGEIEKWEKV